MSTPRTRHRPIDPLVVLAFAALALGTAPAAAASAIRPLPATVLEVSR